MAFMTPEENVVLQYTVRRIFGFQKRQDHISLSQYANGITVVDDDGNESQLDYGTGLSVPTVRKALAGLVEFGLMLEIAANDPRKNHGTFWGLQLDPTKVNLDGLKQRKLQRHARQQKKMEKAKTKKAAQTEQAEQTPAIPLHPCNTIAVTPAIPLQHNNQFENQNHLSPNGDKRKKKSPAKRSPSNTDGKELEKKPNIVYENAKALAAVCKMDFGANQMRLLRDAKQLKAATPEATPQLITEKFGVGGWYYKASKDWRAEKGQLPRPDVIRELWGKWEQRDAKTRIKFDGVMG